MCRQLVVVLCCITGFANLGESRATAKSAAVRVTDEPERAPAREYRSDLNLCDALAGLGPGQELAVDLEGAYLAGFEQSVFYDPQAIRCEVDLQPSVWVELSASAGRALRRFGGPESDPRVALVRFRGLLHGPPLPIPDDPDLPEAIAAVQRAAGRGYGHSNMFRVVFLVDEVASAKWVPEDDVSSPLVGYWQVPAGGVNVVHAEVPVYPDRARKIGLEGDVDIAFSVRNGQVEDVSFVAGDRLFQAASISFVQSLKFDPSNAVTATLRMEYRLERRTWAQGRNSKVEMELPKRVRITAARHDW